MADVVPFSSFLFRGLPGGAGHNKNHTQTAELMEKAAASVDAAETLGRRMEPDEWLSGELYEFVEEAASELGIEAPLLL